MIRIATLLAACLLLPAQPARAETNQCTAIESLPAVVTTQGVYCLKKDLSTSIASGNAITIGANNVTLDCNGWKIGGLGGGPETTAVGIQAIDRKGITIRNCGIRGFRYGIYLGDVNSAYHLVEDNRIDLSTAIGIVVVGGDKTTVRGNRIYDTGGSSFAYGIWMYGPGEVIDNTVQGVLAGNLAFDAAGIYVDAVLGNSFVLHNRISDVRGEANVDGIHVLGRGIAAGNTVARDENDEPTADAGLRCSGGMTVARDNQILGYQLFAYTYTGCGGSGNLVF